MNNNERDKEQIYKLLDKQDEFGEIEISSSVVASIAGLATLEVEGVSNTIGSVANEIADRIGVKSLGKGIKATIIGDEVYLDMNINMRYGYNVLTTCKIIQDKVKQSVENMTGLECKEINICIAGVSTDK